MVYPHSVPSAVSSQLEPAKRKRGRPRKYGTPEQALAAKKAATSSSHYSSKEKKDHAFGTASSYSTSVKKSQSFTLGEFFSKLFFDLFLVANSLASIVKLFDFHVGFSLVCGANLLYMWCVTALYIKKGKKKKKDCLLLSPINPF